MNSTFLIKVHVVFSHDNNKKEQEKQEKGCLKTSASSMNIHVKY